MSETVKELLAAIGGFIVGWICRRFFPGDRPRV
jgi:hypothetical protein